MKKISYPSNPPYMTHIISRIIMGLLLLTLSVSVISCNNRLPAEDLTSHTDHRDSGDINMAQLDEPVNELDMGLVEANTRFGFNIYKELVKEEPGDNIFISPASISLALSMTLNGADGDTREAMARTLEFESFDLETINESNRDLMTILQNPDPVVELAIANSLWAREGINFCEEFLQRNIDYYKAAIEALDFSDPKAVDIINGWVKDNTRGKIEEIVEAPIDPYTILFLINAIYFKGDWTYEFDKEKTVEAPFYMADGTQKGHPMMVQSDDYFYYKGSSFQSVSIPYGEERVSMYVFLPDEDSSIEEFYEELNFYNWESWMSSYYKMEGNIALPRFQFEYEVELNDALKALGMEVAFNRAQADFDNLFSVPLPGNVYIERVKHKTFIDVNEEGTEAAAVTSVEMRTESVQEKFNMIMNRPFFFAIRDNETGTVLFMGTVMEP